MITPKLIPYEAWHLLELDNRNSGDSFNYDDALHKERSPAFTAVVNGKVIGCAGVILMWPGVGHAWVALSSEAAAHGIWLTRTIRNVLRDIIRGCALHRIEAVVYEGYKGNERWIELLGFEREGVACQFTSNRENAIRYAFLVHDVAISVTTESEEVTCTMSLGGSLVGFAKHRYMENEYGRYAYGSGITVLHEFRRRGYAIRLHRARLLAAKRHGARFFVGMTSELNEKMIHILEKCGATKCVNELGVTYVTPLEAINVQ